jgi:hypothetical protein
MSRRHLGCLACRIRLHATAPEIELLEGMCPACGARLKLASSTSDLIGFRLFDLGLLSDEKSSTDVLGCPVDLVIRARDDRERFLGRHLTFMPGQGRSGRTAASGREGPDRFAPNIEQQGDGVLPRGQVDHLRRLRAELQLPAHSESRSTRAPLTITLGRTERSRTQDTREHVHRTSRRSANPG